MNFIFEDINNEAPLPIAFIDNVGDLWFRTNDATYIQDNDVHILTKRGVIMDNMTMDDFINTVNGINNTTTVTVVKAFYVGDTITIKF